MMIFLIPILVLPFAVGLSLVLNIYGDFSHRGSEQLRLDAYILSVCHQRAEFIKDFIVPTNIEIEGLQSEMDQAAEACDKAEAIPTLGEVVCATSLTALKVLGAMGFAKEGQQDLERSKFSEVSKNIRKELEEKNHLSQPWGSLDLDSPLWEDGLRRDGFQRELLSKRRLLWEAKYFTTWPKKLEPDDEFENIHRLIVGFRARRGLLGRKGGVFDYRQIGIQKGGESELKSGCRVDSLTYRVIRK